MIIDGNRPIINDKIVQMAQPYTRNITGPHYMHKLPISKKYYFEQSCCTRLVFISVLVSWEPHLELPHTSVTQLVCV